MKYKNKIISVFLLLTAVLFAASCAKQAAQSAGTPTEAYKKLYAAVKAKDTEKIKQSVSKETQNLAQFMAERQKQPIEKSYENGFTATTFADSLPEMRDERVKDNFASVEVFNTKENRWEDLPFVKEDGEWKLGVGDILKGTFQSPGKGRAEIEREASNVGMPMPTNAAPLPEIPKGKQSITVPAPPANDAKSNEPKSVEVPKEGKPKK